MRSERVLGVLTLFGFSLLALLVFFSFCPAAYGQIPYQEVMGPAPTTWEIDGVGDPFILKENGTYKMWYRGDRFWWAVSYWQNDASIGYAESADGINWAIRQQVHTNGNLLTDYLFASAPWVIREGDTYRMWHADYYIGVGGDWSYYIPHTTSTDGINWGPDQTVLAGKGDRSDYNDYNTGSPSVIRESDGTYSMWYSVNQRTAGTVYSNIVRATSPDGISWPDENPPSVYNRQLVLRRIPGSPEENVGDPDVVREADGTYTMYYLNAAIAQGFWGGAIYRARSTDGTDGITWTSRQRILEAGQLASEILWLSNPHYFKDTDGTEYLYFSYSQPEAGSSTGYRGYIGRARLEDILDATPPSAPTNLVAVAPTSSRINLTWNASTDNVAVSGYNIYNADTNALLATTANTFYNFTGLTSNTTYSYYLKAFDPAGNLSGVSNTASATTPSLQAPTKLTATAKSASRVDLTWETPTPKTGLVGYKIERSPDGSTNWQVIADVPSIGTTSYSNTGLTSSTAYYYRVRSYDSAGNTSDPGNVASAITYAVAIVPVDADISVDLGNQVSLIFSNVNTSGTATVEVLDSATATKFAVDIGKQTKKNLSQKAICYEVTTTALYSGQILVTVPCADITNPNLYHLENSVWVDVTLKVPDSDFPQVTVNPDITNKIVYGKVTSLSPFAVAGPAGPTGVNTYMLLALGLTSLAIGLIVAGKNYHQPM